MNHSFLELSEVKLTESTQIMRSIVHPIRLEMLEFIKNNPWTDVQTIYQSLEIEQSLASQYLAMLRQANVVLTKRQGKHILYHINSTKYVKVHNAISNFLLEDAA